jgi:hypothetical protein
MAHPQMVAVSIARLKGSVALGMSVHTSFNATNQLFCSVVYEVPEEVNWNVQVKLVLA